MQVVVVKFIGMEIQAASLEPRGMELMSKYIRLWSVVRGDGVKRLLDSEVPVKSKLRRIG